jgi:hypothetical protein
MLAHATKPVRAQLFRKRAVLSQLQYSVSQTSRIVGLDQQTAIRSLNNLRERAAVRLDQGHTASHRLE